MTRRRRINVEPLPTVEYGDLAPGCPVRVEGMPGEWVFMYARREASGLVIATITGSVFQIEVPKPHQTGVALSEWTRTGQIEAAGGESGWQAWE
jgi:hypothetical protein